jgi:coenzyme F420-reducing hydrogenase delta subunit
MIPIRVPCTGRLNAQTIITAFAEGADGVAVIGCHEQDCHYRSGAKNARKRMDNLREVVEEFGIDGHRLYFGSVSASERQEFATQVTEFVNKITELGPLGVEFDDKKRKTKRRKASAAGGGSK